MTKDKLLPGFGLPISEIPKCTLPTALQFKDGEDVRQRARITTREYHMMQFMNQVTDKPEWHKKVFDDTISEKWRNEALLGELSLSERSVNWCLQELKHEANQFEKSGIARALDGGVFKADSIIPLDVKEALKKAVRPLEDVPERLRDWHPGSDDKVLDLVHPSLFPLIYGRSRILPKGKVGLHDSTQRIGEGVIVPVPEAENSSPTQNAWSRNFQWLPCDVSFGADENSVKIESYINNLHPQTHKNLYSVIEEILSRTIPLFNRTLRLLENPQLHPPRILCEGIDYPEGFREEDYVGDGTGIRNHYHYMNWYQSREPIIPEPAEEFQPVAISESDYMVLGREYSESGLQVIVKLASIHLTPEKPEYPGGSWHVEGQANEHICSTALYYYDNENISESLLAFRCQVDDDLMDFLYDQSDYSGFEKLFGVSGSFSPAVQNLGAVVTKEDRLITFPNIFQHRVEPFRLTDPTKPGHRKILAFFLVDPNIRIISTADVPCQRKDWWVEEIGSFPTLPREMFDHIMDNVDEFPISMQEAKRLREKLMDERRIYIKDQDQDFNRVEFALCEH